MVKHVLHLSSADYIEKDFKNKAYEAVCALLNSNGGTLVLYTDMTADEIIRPIEQRFKTFISTLDVIKKLRIVCQTAGQIVLETDGHNTLCTMNYNLYLPSNTQAVPVSPLEENDVKEILNVHRIVDITEVNVQIPTKFVINRNIGIKESKTVEFKNLKSGKCGGTDLAVRLKNNKLTHYISAFANHLGGRLYCGVTDDGIVQGQLITDEEKENLVCKVTEYIGKMKWPDYCTEPQKGRKGQWDLVFEPVTDDEGRLIESLYVIIIIISVCQGGVFVTNPESYHIVNGEVQRMAFQQWKRRFLYPSRHPETQLVSKVAPCDWSSSKLKVRCDTLDGKLLRLINNGKWQDHLGKITELITSPDTDDEIRMVVILKQFMAHYRKSEFEEAENCLVQCDKLIPKAKDLMIFELRRKTVHSAMERSRGNHVKSYQLARDCLHQADIIPPGILTVEFFVHFGTMLTIIESSKEIDISPNDLKTGSFKEEAIYYLNRSLQHLQEADYVPQSKIDMKQKTLINIAFLKLGCSLSGDVRDHTICEEDIKSAGECIKQAYESAVDSVGMSNFRKCHLNFARACCCYRKSQIEHCIEKRVDFLESALQEIDEADARARLNDFDELKRYAKFHKKVFQDEMERLPKEYDDLDLF